MPKAPTKTAAPRKRSGSGPKYAIPPGRDKTKAAGTRPGAGAGAGTRTKAGPGAPRKNDQRGETTKAHLKSKTAGRKIGRAHAPAPTAADADASLHTVDAWPAADDRDNRRRSGRGPGGTGRARGARQRQAVQADEDDEGEQGCTGGSETEQEDESGSEEGGHDYLADEDDWEEEDDDYAAPQPVYKRRERHTNARLGAGRAQQKRAKEGSGEITLDGKTISVDQLRAIMRLLQGPAGVGAGAHGVPGHGAPRREGRNLGARPSLGSIGADAHEEEEEEEVIQVDLGMSDGADDEEEYYEAAQAYTAELDAQFRAMAKDNAGVIAAVAHEPTSKVVAACLESRLGTSMLEGYRAWSDSEQTFRSETRAQWDEMIQHMDSSAKTLGGITRKIEQLKNERMKLVVTARKTFEDKLAEHQAEMEGFKLELDKSQKKASRAYKKFTDEEAIGKDVEMKLDDAVRAYTDRFRAAKVGAGRKRKVAEVMPEEEEDESDEDDAGRGEAEDEPEEV